MDRLSRDGHAQDPSTPEGRPRAPHAVFRPLERESAPSSDVDAPPRVGLKACLAVVALYLVVVVAATYPRVFSMKETLPGYRVDSLQHLWIMNWYKSCLLEGKSHLYCPDIQYPTGAPLANFSPMLFQSALFLPLSTAIPNDILCYNLLWLTAFLFTGFSVFVLAWTVLRDRMAATFAGVAGMVCTPMMLRGFGHLELMFAGSMFLFLASWIRWVDRPTWKGLFASAGLYLLSTLCAAYFAVFSVVPAVIYAAWGLGSSGPKGAWPWLRSRIGWFSAFVALVLPGLMLAFSAQIWAVGRGVSMHRSLEEYERYSSPLWAYVLPTPRHALASVIPSNVYDSLGYPEVECASYLGVVTLLLCGYSAIARVGFPKARFWWATGAILVVLSFGGSLRFGSTRIPMPGLWLREYVPIFQVIRAPARFNLLVCGIAALLAGSGLSHLLAKVRDPRAKGAILLAAIALLVVDLGMVPFPSDPYRPSIPPCYAWIRQQNPDAAILEAPLLSSGCCHPLTTTCAYWQASHHLKTSSGYSGFLNAEFDDLLVDDSPFSALKLFDPTSLDRPDSLTVGIVPGVNLSDYAWMVANRAKFDYLVFHRWDDTINERHPAVAKLGMLFRPTLVYEDPLTMVFDTRKLARPSTAVLFCEKGWRAWRERPEPPMRVVGRSAQIGFYSPYGVGLTTLMLDASAHVRARKVVLREGETVLARWEVQPGPMQSLATPLLSLPEGMHTLTLEADGEDRPTSLEDQACSWDNGAYSLKVGRLQSTWIHP